jgi:putative mRNA 3-end processing factor
VNLPDTTCLTHLPKSEFQVGALILAPPSAYGTPWMRKLNPVSSAFASGWMQVRGIKRRKSVDKGFALSDHSDWPSLLKAVALSKAEKVLVTHGYSQIFARYLRENGLHADVLSTQYEGEGEAEDARAAELENASESVIG